MPTHPHDVQVPDAATGPAVQVTLDPHGGWQVEAIRDGRVVASRHSDDWHHVERLRDTLAAELDAETAAAVPKPR